MGATLELLLRRRFPISGAKVTRVAVPAGCAVALLLGLVWLHKGGGLTFYFDEWDFVQTRREWDANALFMPHNGHLVMVPALLYKLLFEAFGLWNYEPYRIAGLIAHGGVVVVVYLYAKSRLGGLAALAPAAMVLCFGPGWADILWPFQVGYLLSLGAGIGGLLALERDDETGDVLTAALLLLSIASGSLGLPILAAAAVEVLCSRRRKERLWVIALPVALYSVWYGAFSPESQIDPSRIYELPEFVLRSAAGSAGALLSSGQLAGGIALLLLVPLAAWRIWRMPTVPVRVWTLLAIPPLLWGLTALARAGLENPNASRYLYPGAVLILLIAIELLRGFTVPLTIAAVLVVTVAITTGLNLRDMNTGFVTLGYASELTSGALAGLELAGPNAKPQLRPEQRAAPQVSAGQYLPAVREYGSPAPAFDELAGVSILTRRSVDETLVAAYRLDKPPPAIGPIGNVAPRVLASRGATVRMRPACAKLRGEPGANQATVAIPAAGITLRADGMGRSTLRLRRFAPDAGTQTPIRLDPGRPVLLRPPPDPSPQPWIVEASFPKNLTACGAP